MIASCIHRDTKCAGSFPSQETAHSYVQIEAWHENKFVETVAQSPLLRSAQKAGKTIGFFADDVLMSAMKSVRNQMGSSASEHTD